MSFSWRACCKRERERRMMQNKGENTRSCIINVVEQNDLKLELELEMNFCLTV